jgi:hypothetical protein
MPHERGLPLQDSPAANPPATLEANTDNFFVNRFAPHLGQAVPCQRLERTMISLSAPHFSQ